MNSRKTPDYDNNFVRPLCEAENEFLQVLVTEFSIKPKGRGLELSVAFAPGSQAIWRRQAKEYLDGLIPGELRKETQTHISEMLKREGTAIRRYSVPGMPFRFGNGGTLPVVRLDGADHYCLFFRDAPPVGWNIANGGANSLHDLLHPDTIIERELREELIIVEPDRGRRYVFEWHDARLRDHSDFAIAHRLWMDRFRQQNHSELREIALPLKWMPPLDMDPAIETTRCYDSISVKYADNRPVHTRHGLITISTEDLGIEFDRIAKLSVGPDAIFCDGELIRGQLLNRVVGLFEVKKFNEALEGGATTFLPDRLFWDGLDRSGEDPSKVVEEYLRAPGREDGLAGLADSEESSGISFRLCPVTGEVIRNYLRLAGNTETNSKVLEEQEPFDVFVSFGVEDRQLARMVYEQLSQEGQHRVFFSAATSNHGPFAPQIDRALETAWALVAVSSRLDHLNKRWVQYEWQSFHNDILSGDKPLQTPFVAFVVGIDPYKLPWPFRERRVVQAEMANLGEALQRLLDCVRRP